MPEVSSHIQIARNAIRVFADDGTLDINELSFLLGIALADGEIDDEERRIPGNVFRRVDRGDVEPRVWERIASVRKKYRI